MSTEYTRAYSALRRSSIKLAAKKDEGSRSNVVPVMAGLGLAGLAGAGMYSHMRKVRPSESAYINKIRERAGDKFTRVLYEDEPTSALARLRDRLLLAGGGNVHYTGIKGDWPAKPKRIKGVVHTAFPNQTRSATSSTGATVGAPRHDAAVINTLDNKANEYDVFNKHAPGALAPSERLDKIINRLGLKKPRTPEKTKAYLSKLQAELNKQFDNRYLLKETEGVQSAGRFPSNDHDFNALLKQYRASGGAKERVEADKLWEAGNYPGMDSVKMYQNLRKNPSYEGRVLEQALKNPRTILVQKRLDLAESKNPIRKALSKITGRTLSNEMRVHVEGGRVAPSLTLPRYGYEGLVFDRKHMRGAEAYAQSVVDKMPKKYRNLSFGMDIAPTADGGYAMMESNAGGNSGMISANTQYWTPHQGIALRKHYVGNYAKPVAAAGALGTAATVGTLGGLGVQKITQPDGRQP